jgi:hypothetical protein
MGRLCRRVFGFALAALFFCGISGCGGHRPAGSSNFPAKVTLLPTSGASVQLGSILVFTATAQNAADGNVNASFTFTSSNTSILNIAPGGIACAGVWNPTYTVCTPGASGPVEVTASADGQSSAPTLVFVHPAIDNMTVTGVVLTGTPPQEPCLSQGQTMTVEAHAFSQGTDITSSVGTFTWSANNSNVVTITPIVNNVVFNGFTFNVALNQATLAAANPGLTEIYATANGASSTTFQQPIPFPYQGTQVFPDFFETCNIQNITLQVGPTGIEQSGQTTFIAAKGSAQNANAVVTDIAGNTSLTNTNGNVVLSKIPLTWTASQPAVVANAAGCTLSCGITTPSVGAGTLTASCTPPSCNIGFPFIPLSLSNPALVAACTQFFSGMFPGNPNFNCEQLIPVPVYSSSPISSLALPIPQTGGISGLVTGSTTPASVLASSAGCANVSPETCITGIYSFATAKSVPGSVNAMPTSANSLLFDLAGDKAYMGSEFGAQLLNPSNLGTSNNAFTPLGTVTGQILAISNSGTIAAFSDIVHTPNQVYIVNTTNTNSTSATALNINSALAAAFSPDGLKTFILGDEGDSLYVYSSLQALQGPGSAGPGTNPQLALTGGATSMAFSTNGAFLFLAETSLNGSTPNFTAFDVCDNSIATSTAATGGVPAVVNLPANPLFMQVLPGFHIDGTDSAGNSIPDGIHIFILDSTGFDVLTASTSPAAPGTLCPQNLTFSSTLINGTPTLFQRVELGQGTIQPINFFSSADGSLLYVLTNNSSSVLVYDFGTRAVTGIPLQGNAIPQTAAMTVDAGTILAAANDGKLHEISTALTGTDLFQIPFPNFPNYLNPFCTYAPNQVPCTLNLLAVKP